MNVVKDAKGLYTKHVTSKHVLLTQHIGIALFVKNRNQLDELGIFIKQTPHLFQSSL